VCAASPSYKKSVAKKLHVLWKAKPSLVQETMSILLSGSPSLETLPLLSFLTDYIGKPTEQYESMSTEKPR